MRISDWSSDVCSSDLLEAQGSVLTNKYAEGYPGKRYYQGCAPSDEIEQLAIDRAKQLFNCSFVNVQPHSGAQANGAVMLALTKPGDTIMGLSLDAGGHLTHGAKRSEEHTSELQSLMRISYAVFCLKKKKSKTPTPRES